MAEDDSSLELPHLRIGVTRESDLVSQVTRLLARHDPAWILRDNPDAPADEYEHEANEVLRRVASTAGSEAEVRRVLRQVFHEELGGEEVSRKRLQAASADLHALLRDQSHSDV